MIGQVLVRRHQVTVLMAVNNRQAMGVPLLRGLHAFSVRVGGA